MNFYNAPQYTQSQLALLDNDEVVYPYSDEYAVYLGNKHQYELTRAYFEERGHILEIEVDGTNPDKIKNFLSYVRIKTYNYIYSHSKSTRAQINFMIAKRGINGFDMYEYRQEFLEAMFLQGIYMLNNGDISQVSGVDLDTMQNMSIDVIKYQERDYSKDALMKLTQLGLKYFGRYCFMPQGTDW